MMKKFFLFFAITPVWLCILSCAASCVGAWALGNLSSISVSFWDNIGNARIPAVPALSQSAFEFSASLVLVLTVAAITILVLLFSGIWGIYVVSRDSQSRQKHLAVIRQKTPVLHLS